MNTSKMAKKRGEVALQEEIVDEDSWNALRMKQGLIGIQSNVS